MVDREDGTGPSDAIGIQRHLFMTFEFFYQRPGLLISRKFVEGSTDAAGFRYRKVKEIFLCPLGKPDCVHLYPVGIAEFVEFAGRMVPDVGKSFLDRPEGIFADRFRVNL